MTRSRNLFDTLNGLAEHWSPKVVGRVNDQLVKVARLKGEFVWHAHEGEEELFLVLKGALAIHFEDHIAELREGDLLTVPRGVRHKPVAQEECWVMLVEPASTKHTGEEVTPLTRTLAEQMD